MADKKYFINNGAANVGPFTMSTIIDKVNLSELKATDQLCVSVDNDEWMMICQHPEFITHFNKNKPPKKPLPGQTPQNQGGPKLVTPESKTHVKPLVADVKHAVEVLQAIDFKDAVIDHDREDTEAAKGPEAVDNSPKLNSHGPPLEAKLVEKVDAPKAAHDVVPSVAAAPYEAPAMNEAPVVTVAKTVIETPVAVQAQQVSELAHEPVASKIAVAQIALPVTEAVVEADLTVSQWFILKGKNRFGPFMYVDVIRMLQEKSVFEFDYVWAQGVDKWKRIAEIAVFSPEHIRALFGGDTEEKGLFFRRNFPRAKYETSLICHDNNKIWKGKTVEISEGGAGVVIENALILPGQNVYLHFKPGPFSKSFNALSEVVSKQFMNGLRDNEAPVLYGIKFININKQDRESIRLIHVAA